MAVTKVNERRIPQSIGKEIETVEDKLEKLKAEANALLSYLRFLKERELQFSEEEERSTSSVQLPAVQIPSLNPRKPAENDPQAEKQYHVTIFFMIILFVTMAFFWVASGIEGAKTAWLLMGPMLSVMIYTLFKGR